MDSYLYQEWYSEYVGIDIDLAPAEIASPEQVNHKCLRRACRRAGVPLTYLPLALAMLELRTGNLWLDESECWYQGYSQTTCPWTKTNIRILTREYRLATRLSRLAGELIGWLEQNLNTRVPTVIHLWNSST